MCCTATIEWHRREAAFFERKYSRARRWHFDNGVVVAASSSPAIVPLPDWERSGADPEEASVASLSSRDLLRSLSIAAERGFVVDTYVDEAERVLARNEARRLAITEVTLHPGVRFLDAAPEGATVRRIVRVEPCVV